MDNDLNWYLISKVSEGTVSVETIEAIIELGASVDAVNPFTKETVLITAIRQSSYEVIQYFVLNTEKINWQDNLGRTALIHAVMKGNRYMVGLLIDNDADINIVDNNNKRATDYATERDIKVIFEDIIKQEEAVEQQNIINESDFILYDHKQLHKELDEENNERRSHYLNLLNKSGPTRDIIKTRRNTIRRVQSLESKFPNFSKAINYYLEQIHLCDITDERFIETKPLLLTGIAGVGKTQFCHEVVNALNLNLNIIQCSTNTAGFVLGGGSSQWNGARPGKVHAILRDSEEANPFILLDEIDKMGGDIRYDSYGSLYSLLEKNTAKKFVDELIELPLDCSRINWIATANELSSIPDPILSRFSIIKIREPNKDEVKKITYSIYSNILCENKWGKRFSNKLDDNLVSSLAHISPRQIKSVLLSGCGRAVKERKCDMYSLRVDDIDLGFTDKKPKIGFLT